MEAETLSDTLADVKVEELLHAMADTITEVDAETLYEILDEAVDDTLAKD